jgi:hypothetical protein
MLTEQEFQALVTVLQRAALNPVEVLTIDAIVRKLAPPPQQPQPKEEGNK